MLPKEEHFSNTNENFFNCLNRNSYIVDIEQSAAVDYTTISVAYTRMF